MTMVRVANIVASSGPPPAGVAGREGDPPESFAIDTDPRGRNDRNKAGELEGLAAGLRAGSRTTAEHYANEPVGHTRQTLGSIDVRLPCERPKSKKFNRTSSFQCFVDMDGWIKAFPQLTMDDLGPGFSSSSFQNSEGLKIATYSWRQAGAPRAAIVLFHSYTSYTLFDFLRHQPPSDASQDVKEDATWVQKYPGMSNRRALATA